MKTYEVIVKVMCEDETIGFSSVVYETKDLNMALRVKNNVHVDAESLLQDSAG